jgi:hypothetical protein
MLKDERVLEMTAASEAAVRHYDDTFASYMGLRLDTVGHLKAVLGAGRCEDSRVGTSCGIET